MVRDAMFKHAQWMQMQLKAFASVEHDWTWHILPMVSSKAGKSAELVPSACMLAV